jgi:ATP-binding protein involved in chromosome partitioning
MSPTQETAAADPANARRLGEIASAAVQAALASEAEPGRRVLGVATFGDGRLRVDLDSTGLDLTAKLALERAVRDGVAAAPGLAAALGEQWSVFFRKAGSSPAPRPAEARPAAPFGLELDKRAIPGVTSVVVVASGKGGVGKSTVSVNLAVALARSGLRAGLLDADIYGPSAPLMLGLDGAKPRVRGAQLEPLEAYGVKAASFGFLTDTREPVIWRGPLIAKAFRQLAYDVAWGELDVLVVDLPPGTGDVQLALVESLPLHGAVVVTTPQDVALLDVHKAVSMFARLDVPLLGVVENMAFYRCPHCGETSHVFGEHGGERLAAERKLPFLGRLPLARAVREAGDAGRPVALGDDALAQPYRKLAATVASGLRLRHTAH